MYAKGDMLYVCVYAKGHGTQWIVMSRECKSHISQW